MPFCHNIFSIEINGLKSLFNRLSLQTIIFYNNDFGNYLDFCGLPLIFNMNMNGVHDHWDKRKFVFRI